MDQEFGLWDGAIAELGWYPFPPIGWGWDGGAAMGLPCHRWWGWAIAALGLRPFPFDWGGLIGPSLRSACALSPFDWGDLIRPSLRLACACSPLIGEA